MKSSEGDSRLAFAIFVSDLCGAKGIHNKVGDNILEILNRRAAIVYVDKSDRTVSIEFQRLLPKQVRLLRIELVANQIFTPIIVNRQPNVRNNLRCWFFSFFH